MAACVAPAEEGCTAVFCAGKKMMDLSAVVAPQAGDVQGLSVTGAKT